MQFIFERLVPASVKPDGSGGEDRASKEPDGDNRVINERGREERFIQPDKASSDSDIEAADGHKVANRVTKVTVKGTAG
jgi:hypothetical protein